MSNNMPKAQVLLSLGLGLIAFGFAPILVRLAPGTPPLVLASYRTVFAALFLIPYWFTHRDTSQSVSNRKEKVLVTCSGICLGIHFVCWIASLYYTSVASSSVLVTIHPVILILVERLWFKREFSATTWLGVFLAFAGSVILGISDSQTAQQFSDPLLGNTLALCAALIFVVYLLIGQQVRQNREWINYVFPVYTSAAVTCVVLTVWAGQDLFDFSFAGLTVGIGLALGPQILGHGSMNYAVKFVSPTLLSTLVLTEPMLASILAFFLFDELPPATSIIAMIIILLGVALTWRKRPRSQTVPSENL